MPDHWLKAGASGPPPRTFKEKKVENIPIKIRTLLKADQDTISGMLGKAAACLDGNTIRSAISSAAPQGDEGEELDTAERSARVISVFMELFKTVLVNFGEDVSAFFADLAGMTPEEYRMQPIDIDMQILEQLKDAPEVENFFTIASRLYKTTKLFQDIRKNLIAKFGTITDFLTKD